VQGGNEVRLDDCGRKTADGDVLQTPKPTDPARTDTMAPCRVGTERREHTESEHDAFSDVQPV